MTQQHITQEQAVALSIKSGDEFAIHEAEFYTNLCNAAIQHYLDQRKAELPVLPDLDTWSAGICIRTDVCQQRMKAYGQQCAAQARGLALDEAKSLISKLDAMVVSLKPYEIVNAIEALKGK